MTTTANAPLGLASPGRILDPDALSEVLGPIVELRRSSVDNGGFSGASFERVHVRSRGEPMRALILKRVPLGRDWISLRMGDGVGRTAALLAAPDLEDLWEVFHCPYVAYASDQEEMTLLMEDLGEHLFPDERTPLPLASEDALLGVLARLHARFWESPALDSSWLTPMAPRLDLLRPGERSVDALGSPPPVIRDGLARGWRAALRRLPSTLRRGMTVSAEELAGLWHGLPRTLLHGDTKVANFAVLPDGKVSAFDWSVVGAGSPGLDLGWYLAMNASRLARSKEGMLDRYRELLEEALGRRIPDGEWERTVDFAVWCGARSMLWSKALALESGREGAEEEWEWWLDRLTRTALP